MYKIILSNKRDSNSFWNTWFAKEVTFDYLVTKLTNHRIVNCTLEEYQEHKEWTKRIDRKNKEIRELKKSGQNIEKELLELQNLRLEVAEALKILELNNPVLKNAKDWGSFIPCESKLRFHEKSWKYVSSKLKKDILNHTMLKLDIDDGGIDVYQELDKITNRAIVYSTFSHTQENPKLRVIIPLKEPLTPLEWEYVSKKYVETLNLKGVDSASHRIQQIMYFPARPKDAECFTRVISGDELDGKSMLIAGWEDEFPLKKQRCPKVSKEPKGFKTPKDDMSDANGIHPHDIKGIRGIFNSACGNIVEAIEMFIPEIYENSIEPNRLKYTNGTSQTAGAILFNHSSGDEGYQFMYSHHSSDPVYGNLVDTYELILAHKFDSYPEDKGTIRYSEIKEKFNQWIKGTRLVQEYYFNLITELEHEELNKEDEIKIDSILTGFKLIDYKCYKSFKSEESFYFGVECPTHAGFEKSGKLECYIKVSNKTIEFYCPSCVRNEMHLAHEYIVIKNIKENNPIGKELSGILLLNDLKRCLKITLGREFIINDDRVFHNILIKDTQVIAGTGAGKTHESAKRVLYNLINENVLTIYATKENENVRDMLQEIKKAIDMYTPIKTERIKKFIDSDDSLSDLGIIALTSINKIDKANIPKYNAIITNHSYFSNMGDIAEYNHYMIAILEDSRKKSIIIDEFESYKKKLQNIIRLNNYVYKMADIDSKKSWYQTSSCLFKNGTDWIKQEEKIEYPELNVMQDLRFKDNRGVDEYVLNPHGTKNILDEFNRCTKVISVEYEDKKDYIELIENKLFYRYLEKLENREFTEYEFEETNFIRLLQKSNGISMAQRIIVFEFEGQEYTIDNLYDLQEFLRLKVQSDDEIIAIKEVLNRDSHFTSAPDLFVKYAILNVKSLLEVMDNSQNDMYYVSANEVKGLEIETNDALKFLTSPEIKSINFIGLQAVNNIDKHLKKVCELSRANDFQSLVFYAFKSNHDELYKTNFEWVTPKGKNDDNPDSRQKAGRIIKGCEPDNSIESTVTTAYINGSETQGKNYVNTEFLVLNLEIAKNIKGRIYYDYLKSRNCIQTLEEAQFEMITQAIGRILRVDLNDIKSNKTILLIGDVEIENKKTGEIKDSEKLEKIIDFYKSFSFDTTYEKYNKQISYNKAIEQILTYVKGYLDNMNRNGTNDLEVLHFNNDLRQHKKCKSNKDEIIEIYKQYINTMTNTEIYKQYIQSEFGITERTFRNYIKGV